MFPADLAGEFATTTMPRIRLRGMGPPPLPETEVKQARFECRQLYDRSVAVQAHLCYAMRENEFCSNADNETIAVNNLSNVHSIAVVESSTAMVPA